MSLIRKIMSLLTRKDKINLILITFSTMLISFLEVAALSSTMLFIATIVKFKTLKDIKPIKYLFRFTGPLTNSQIVIIIGLSLIALYVSRCLIQFLF